MNSTTVLNTDLLTPLGAYLHLRGAGRGAFLLESVEQGRLGRYSLVGSGDRLVSFEEAEALAEPVVGYLGYDHVAQLEPTVRLPDTGSGLPESLYHGLVAHGVSTSAATRVSRLPPVSTLFAAFLGYNPVQHLIGPTVLSHLTTAQQASLTGRSFFPGLIAAPFRSGLHAALDFAIVASLLAAAASWVRGSKSDEELPVNAALDVSVD